MRTVCCLMVGLLMPAFACAGGSGNTETYTLRYKFAPGQTLRWNVLHRANVHTTVSGTTKTVDTTSKSVKLWRVTDVHDDGSATFEHLVESVDMRHKLSGSSEVRYNSLADRKPPAGFEHLAQSIGVPLSIITMDASGKVLRREQKQAKAAAKSKGPMTIPLPEEPVAVGQSWSFPHKVDVTLPGGAIKKVETLQRFTLSGVKTGVATIRVSTTILTPIDDPAVRSQLIERESAGTVRFDVDAGRILSQQMDLDKGVVGFRGPASSLHYITRFSEEFVRDVPMTAARPVRRR